MLANLDKQMLSSCFNVDHLDRNIDLNARHNSGWTAFRSMLKCGTVVNLSATLLPQIVMEKAVHTTPLVK